MYRDNPHHSPPNIYMWFCIETPSVFREHKLPADNSTWTRADKRKYAELERLAEQHGTYVQCNSYQRG